jgi:putative ABC transport system permease protein
VLGAPVLVIVARLSVRFVWLVLLAIAIAVPLAWLALGHWLENFSYRIDLGIGLFAVSGFAALLLAMFTVSLRALKAASANPVKNLRTE